MSRVNPLPSNEARVTIVASIPRRNTVGAPQTISGRHSGPTRRSRAATPTGLIIGRSATMPNAGRYSRYPTTPWRPGGAPVEREVRATVVVDGNTVDRGRAFRRQRSARGDPRPAQCASCRSPRASTRNTITGPSARPPRNGSRSEASGGPMGGGARLPPPTASKTVAAMFDRDRPSYAGRARPGYRNGTNGDGPVATFDVSDEAAPTGAPPRRWWPRGRRARRG